MRLFGLTEKNIKKNTQKYIRNKKKYFIFAKSTKIVYVFISITCYEEYDTYIIIKASFRGWLSTKCSHNL